MDNGTEVVVDRDGTGVTGRNERTMRPRRVSDSVLFVLPIGIGYSSIRYGCGASNLFRKICARYHIVLQSFSKTEICGTLKTELLSMISLPMPR